METLDFLQKKYGITMTLKDLAEELHMSVHGVRAAIFRGSFPVSTYRIGKRRVADSRDVAVYLDQMWDETTEEAGDYVCHR